MPCSIYNKVTGRADEMTLLFDNLTKEPFPREVEFLSDKKIREEAYYVSIILQNLPKYFQASFLFFAI